MPPQNRHFMTISKSTTTAGFLDASMTLSTAGWTPKYRRSWRLGTTLRSPDSGYNVSMRIDAELPKMSTERTATRIQAVPQTADVLFLCDKIGSF